MEALHQTILEHAHDRRPSCFRAHVSGQGYINDGTRADLEGAYLEQYRKALRTEVERMTWAPDYAERGYTLDGKKGILLANWNVFPRETADLLEQEYHLEWSDEWDQCEECQKIFRTSADSYVWEPSGTYVDGIGSICKACRSEL